VEQDKKRHGSLRGLVERNHTFVETLAGVFGVLGVFLLVWQLNQAQESIRSDTINQIYGHMVEIDKFFFEHPELKPYFYDDKYIGEDNPLFDQSEASFEMHRAQVYATTEMIADFFSEALLGVSHLKDSTYQGWREYIKYVYKSSPPLRQLYCQRKDWYKDELAGELFEEAHQEMGGPNLPEIAIGDCPSAERPAKGITS
jgi:hypothetical protein